MVTNSAHSLSLVGKIVRRLFVKPRNDPGTFRGLFDSHAQAMASVYPDLLVGYDHEEIADVAFERMCQLLFWDWPVLYWLQRLAPETRCLLDAGGHMGTKYRAFRNHLDLENGLRWIVYDVPSIVRAGRERAKKDGLNRLEFIEQLNEAPVPDVLLASGLLQYLTTPFDDFLMQLPLLPHHLVLNKVAIHDGPAVFTLENFRKAEVPYQIRNHRDFDTMLAKLGYEVIDQWQIESLTHRIRDRSRTVTSSSHGYYCRLRSSEAANVHSECAAI